MTSQTTASGVLGAASLGSSTAGTAGKFLVPASLPPLPAWAILVTPPGATNPINYSAYLDYSATNLQARIQQSFGRQGSTASFPLTFEHGDNSVPTIIYPMSRVLIVDTISGNPIFGGLINDPAFVFVSPNLVTWNCQCVDYSINASGATVYAAYSGLTMDEVIVDLVLNANCGITANFVSQGGYVAPGPVIPFMQFQWQTLTQCLDQVATYASQSSQYGWFVDETQEVHFFNQFQGAPPTVTITDDPMAGQGSTNLAHVEVNAMLSYEYDGTSLYNQITCIGSQISIPVNTEGPPTQGWTGDGSTTIFTLIWPITQEDTAATFIGIQAYLLVGGQPYVVGLQEVESQVQTTTTQWVISQTSAGQWVLVSLVGPPPAGVLVELWYPYEIPVIGVAQDIVSIQNYGHTWTEIITDSTLLTEQACFARAQADLTEYSKVQENLNCYTTEDFTGHINVGDIIWCNLSQFPDSTRGYALGIQDAYICTSNTIVMLATGFHQYQLTLLRISTS